jgi:D-alanyl-D-alanine carboxypeptidase
MTTKTRLHASLAALVGAAALATTVPAAGAAVPSDPAGPRLQTILERAVRSPKTTFPGVALYVRRPGHASWSGAAGKMHAGDRFRAGSIMKPFVAAATLQLAEEGRFSLDDPLTAVLPERVTARFPGAGGITVRMLLDHTSGIGDGVDSRFDRMVFADPLRRWTTSELLDRSAAKPRTGAPGERFAYSNANYLLLGAVLEQATGKSWREVVRERVIDRLGLTHTSLPRPGRMPAGRDIARAYEVVGGRLRDVTRVDSSMAGAAGGHALLTTTADLSRFLHGVLAGRLFRDQETLEQMRTFLRTPNDHGRVGYGLGLERYVLPGGIEMVGHMGTTAGYRALMFRLPAQNVEFAMVTTTPDDPTPVIMPALKVLLG